MKKLNKKIIIAFTIIVLLIGTFAGTYLLMNKTNNSQIPVKNIYAVTYPNLELNKDFFLQKGESAQIDGDIKVILNKYYSSWCGFEMLCYDVNLDLIYKDGDKTSTNIKVSRIPKLNNIEFNSYKISIINYNYQYLKDTIITTITGRIDNFPQEYSDYSIKFVVTKIA